MLMNPSSLKSIRYIRFENFLLNTTFLVILAMTVGFIYDENQTRIR